MLDYKFLSWTVCKPLKNEIFRIRIVRFEKPWLYIGEEF